MIAKVVSGFFAALLAVFLVGALFGASPEARGNFVHSVLTDVGRFASHAGGGAGK